LEFNKQFERAKEFYNLTSDEETMAEATTFKDLKLKEGLKPLSRVEFRRELKYLKKLASKL